MAAAVNLEGWEGARMEIYITSAYVPIACITSRSESNESQLIEKTNVCTAGETVSSVKQINRTVDLEGEVVDANSLDALKLAQNSKLEQYFKVYKGTGTTTPEFFKGIINSIGESYTAGEDATFSMSVTINGDYSATDLRA